LRRQRRRFDTTRTIDPKNPAHDAGEERWSFIKQSHELYNVGHMYEAAVAHYMATGKRNFLDIAIKNADLIDRVFGPGKRYDVPGHEEIEIGLAKLSVTARKILKLAKFFLISAVTPNTRTSTVNTLKINAGVTQDRLSVFGGAGYLYSAWRHCGLGGDRIYSGLIEFGKTLSCGNCIYRWIRSARGGEASAKITNFQRQRYNETLRGDRNAMWNHRVSAAWRCVFIEGSSGSCLTDSCRASRCRRYFFFSHPSIGRAKSFAWFDCRVADQC
jgi:Fe-S-cluster containining protein